MRTVFLFLLSALPLLSSELSDRLHLLADRATWERTAAIRPKVTPDALDQAIEAARAYYLNAQLPEGNFRYLLDCTTNQEYNDDNQVRQAGALWGLSRLCRERFTEATRRSLLLGLDFFLRNRKPYGKGGPLIITYKGARLVKTGTVALFCLALVDFLEGQERYLPAAQRQPYIDALATHLAFLRILELPDGSWRDSCNLQRPPSEQGKAECSPYYDGEALLAYLAAQRYFAARPQLKRPAGLDERIHFALPALLKKHVVDSLHPEGDGDRVKGFFQWGLMSCALYCEQNQGPVADLAFDGGLALAWWQIYGNRLDTRNGNTGYAIEGMVAAWRLSAARQRHAEAAAFREAIDATLARLMTWQVGGPFESLNPYLSHWKSRIPDRAQGGITAAADSGLIRIDTVQHQLHAMLLARKYLYR